MQLSILQQDPSISIVVYALLLINLDPVMLELSPLKVIAPPESYALFLENVQLIILAFFPVIYAALFARLSIIEQLIKVILS